MSASDADPFLRARIAAAEFHATRFLHGMTAAADPDTQLVAGLARPPQWLTDAWRHHLHLTTIPGQGFKCVHLNLHVPELAHVALWAPGITLCTACVEEGALQVLAEDRDEKAARTCDGCGTYVEAGLHRATYKHQITLIWFAVCPTCRDELHVTPDPDHTP